VTRGGWVRRVRVAGWVQQMRARTRSGRQPRRRRSLGRAAVVVGMRGGGCIAATPSQPERCSRTAARHHRNLRKGGRERARARVREKEGRERARPCSIAVMPSSHLTDREVLCARFGGFSKHARIHSIQPQPHVENVIVRWRQGRKRAGALRSMSVYTHTHTVHTHTQTRVCVQHMFTHTHAQVRLHAHLQKGVM
jgi:hypothetical protein